LLAAAVDIFGPVLQREFLMGLGIDIRLTELVKSVSDDEAERLFGEFMRLVVCSYSIFI
jgi:SAM-dependent MidA family methyltransferase